MTIDYRVATLEEMRAYHEARIRLLELLAERAQTTLEQQYERLVEARRDTANTQRLWVNLCKKYGWLEDEDLLGG